MGGGKENYNHVLTDNMYGFWNFDWLRRLRNQYKERQNKIQN